PPAAGHRPAIRLSTARRAWDLLMGAKGECSARPQALAAIPGLGHIFLVAAALRAWPFPESQITPRPRAPHALLSAAGQGIIHHDPTRHLPRRPARTRRPGACRPA